MGLLLSATIVASTVVGYSSAYAPGVFDDVVRVRNENDWWRNDIPGDWYTVAGYIAVTDCDRVGQDTFIRPFGSDKWDRVLIADCVGDIHTLEWMNNNNIVAELDHDLYEKYFLKFGKPLLIEVMQ